MAGTNAQIIHILRNADEPMDAHSIYAAGAFDYEHTCYNGLAQLSKKGLVQREKVNGRFEYVIDKKAPVPNYMERDLAELEIEGMPAPDPLRRIGLSRAEYTGLSTDEKRTLRQTRSVIHRETEITEVSESIPEAPAPVATVPQAAPEPGALPAPVTNAQPSQELILADLKERKAAIEREIAQVQLISDITKEGGGDLSFFLTDYADMLDFAISGSGSDDDKMMEGHQSKARAYAELLKAASAEDSIFRRAAHQLLQWAFLNEDAHAGCNDDTGIEARKDAAESRKLAALFGVPSKHGEQP